MEVTSVIETYTDKHILLLGSTGFLGKVILAMLLQRLPQIAHLYVLIRPQPNKSASHRFDEILETSPIFATMRNQMGDKLRDYLNRQVTVLSGDVTLPGMGLDEASKKSLRQNLDLVINSAGIVDFNPDISELLAVNVQGTVDAADFTLTCDHATFLHISTCYVAGVRNGIIPEDMHPTTPLGKPFIFADEMSALQKLIADNAADNPEIDKKIQAKQLAAAGQARSESLGWPNSYTYSKALAEAYLVGLQDKLRFAIVRPSIVECALEFPLKGWNEGYNTCAPLAYVAGSWYPFLPAKSDHILDIIPVDLVANAVLVVGAALLNNKYHMIYQCATSHTNPFYIAKGCIVVRNWYRKHYREKLTDKIKLFLNIHTIHPDSILSAKKLYQLFQYLPKSWREKSTTLKKIQKGLWRFDRLQQIYRPFVYENQYYYVSENIKAIKIKEPEFEFSNEKINWEDYWQNVQMPGLARWCFALLKKD